jgi:2-iminobutanoate/2-iminopropanoate deaminase
VNTNKTRRAFLRRAGAVGSAAVLSGTAVAATDPAAPSPRKRIVEGSPYPTFSRATVFDRMVFVAGVVGQKPGSRDLASPEFEPQCRQALQNLRESVEAAGSSMDRVLKCNCFLTSDDDFATFNKVYVTFFPSEPPARSTVVVKALVVPGAKLEIDCVAHL